MSRNKEKLQQSIRDAVHTRETIERLRKNFIEECPPEPDEYSLRQIGHLVKYFLILAKYEFICFFKVRKMSYLQKRLERR